MDKALIVFACSALLSFTIAAIAFVFMHLKKSLVSTGVQLQCNSGDSEVMVINLNFYEGESEESKRSKIAEGFDRIEARRSENHLKWLQIKEQAIQENEAQQAQGKDLKLKSVTQEPQEKTQH